MEKLRDLKNGAMFEGTLVVRSATARETKAGKPFLTLELFDGMDAIKANYWDWSSGKIPAVNSIVDVTAQVTDWQGSLQLSIKTMQLNQTRSLAEFTPNSGCNIEDAYRQAYELACAIHNDELRDLLLAVLDELKVKWLETPGACTVHHAYVGGTLVHSVGVAKLALAMASSIPEANTDLCVAGGLLHDIGKLFTYAINGISIEMTDDGKLFEHSFIGAEFISNFADSHLNTDNDQTARLVQLLKHIILSHHGKLEYGAAVPPQCVEALIVSSADGLDASVEQLRKAARNIKEGTKWTDRIYTLNNACCLDPDYVAKVMS